MIPTLRGDVDNHLTLTAMASMLPQIDSLPRAKAQFSIQNRDRNGRGGQSTLDVSRHVVRTFHCVGIQRIVLFHQPIEPGFQIPLHIGIGIFLDHEAG